MEKKEDFKNSLKTDLNYQTQVDVFMPHKPKIIVDHPIHPTAHMEQEELKEAYNRIYKEVLGKEDDERE